MYTLNFGKLLFLQKRKRSNTVDNSASVQKEQTDDEGTVTGKDDIAVLSTTKKKDKVKKTA